MTAWSSLTRAGVQGERLEPARRDCGLDEPAARSQWEAIVAAQDADVAVLDDVLVGEHVEEALSPAAAHRFLLASTDWTDTFALLERLLARPYGRALLGRRPLAILQQRMVVREADGKAAPGAPAVRREALFEALILSDAMRAAVRSGADTRKLQVMAAQDGFQALADQFRQRQQSGQLSAAETARALG